MCLFCQIPAADIVAGNTSHIVIRDTFSVSPGHSLIISRRHVASLFELTAEEFSSAPATLLTFWGY